MKNLLFFCLLMVASCFALFGQSLVSQERVEIDSEGYTDYKVLACGEEGMVMLAREEKSGFRGGKYTLWHYNSKLLPTQEERFQAGEKLFFDRLLWEDGKVLLFFYNRRFGEYEFQVLDAKSLQGPKLTGLLPKKTDIQQVTLKNGKIYLTAIQKKAPFLYIFDVPSGKRKVVPLTEKRSRIESLRADPQSDQVYFSMSKELGTKQHQFLVKVLEGDKTVANFNLSAKSKYTISSATGTHLEGDAYLFTGTYSSIFTSAHINNNMGEGIYFAKGSRNKIEWMRFYPFSKMENFFQYLSKKWQEKMAKKVEKKGAKGKTFNPKYMMAMHNVQQVDGKYYLIGEAYLPTHTLAMSATDGGSNLEFDGYQYSHAVITCFDAEGNLLWDQVFKMWPRYKPRTEQLFVRPAFFGDRLDLLFSDYRSVHSKSLDLEGNVLQEKEVKLLNTGKESEEVKTRFSYLAHWYGGYFLTFGRQLIKQTTEQAPHQVRGVYFLNKVTN